MEKIIDELKKLDEMILEHDINVKEEFKKNMKSLKFNFPELTNEIDKKLNVLLKKLE